jgi:hypothetical protein
MTGHQPTVTRVSTITVTCATAGPHANPASSADTTRWPVLADLEAFTAELRRLGVHGDAPIPITGRLTVTLPGGREQASGCQ